MKDQMVMAILYEPTKTISCKLHHLHSIIFISERDFDDVVLKGRNSRFDGYDWGTNWYVKPQVPKKKPGVRSITARQRLNQLFPHYGIRLRREGP